MGANFVIKFTGAHLYMAPVEAVTTIHMHRSFGICVCVRTETPTARYFQSRFNALLRQDKLVIEFMEREISSNDINHTTTNYAKHCKLNDSDRL